MARPRKMTEEALTWLAANYQSMTNVELARRLGVSTKTIGHYAGQLGLRKKDRMKFSRITAERLGREKLAERNRKIGQRRREMYASERRRVLFGLEQRTGIRVVRASKAKANLRSRMRAMGYEIGHGSNEVTVTALTRRSVRYEGMAAGMGMYIIFR